MNSRTTAIFSTGSTYLDSLTRYHIFSKAWTNPTDYLKDARWAANYVDNQQKCQDEYTNKDEL